MSFTSLVSTEFLAEHLDDPQWVIVDCRFTLNFPDQKEQNYLEAHISGASYAHLDRDLASPVIQGITGRHPLPDVAKCVERFSEWGIGPETQVVVYDDAGGAIASRLWWLLHWLGHEKTALLNGGWQHWVEEGRACGQGTETFRPQYFQAQPSKNWVCNTEGIQERMKSRETLLLDVRNPSRYRGEKELIDPVAGHIPGAINEPFQVNLDSEGYWKSTENLRKHYLQRFPGFPEKQVVSYCGSGVTACHTFFALRYAGFGETFIYPGSWSEWIINPSRPVALGDENYIDPSS